MKRVLITRPREQANDFADKLCAAGFEPIFFPVIEIRPIENNIVLERALVKIGMLRLDRLYIGKCGRCCV